MGFGLGAVADGVKTADGVELVAEVAGEVVVALPRRAEIVFHEIAKRDLARLHATARGVIFIRGEVR